MPDLFGELIYVTVPNFLPIGQTVPRYRDFWIFHEGGRRHLGFLTFKFVTFSRGSNCVTMLDFVEIAETAADIWRFVEFSKWWRPPSLDFLNYKFLTVRCVMSVDATFRGDLSTHCRDIAIFGFFMMAAIRHRGFVTRVLGPPTKGICWSLSLCKIWLESMQ